MGALRIISYCLVKDKNEEMANDNRQPASFRTKPANHAHQILLGPHRAIGEAIFVLNSPTYHRVDITFLGCSEALSPPEPSCPDTVDVPEGCS